MISTRIWAFNQSSCMFDWNFETWFAFGQLNQFLFDLRKLDLSHRLMNFLMIYCLLFGTLFFLRHFHTIALILVSNWFFIKLRLVKMSRSSPAHIARHDVIIQLKVLSDLDLIVRLWCARFYVNSPVNIILHAIIDFQDWAFFWFTDNDYRFEDVRSFRGGFVIA